MIQKIEEIVRDIFKKEVVMMIVNRDMKDSVLIALQMMNLWNFKWVWPLLH